MSFWRYSNPAWEPYFKELSPFLGKVYFATNIGPLRYLVATLIFKKISYIERKMMGDHYGRKR